MKIHNILQTVLVEFRSRVRESNYVIFLAAVLFIGFLVLSETFIVRLDSYRGVYNSAWVGSLMAVVSNFFVGLLGFYIVNSSVKKDRDLGLMPILSITSLSKVEYIVGKWLANSLYLLSGVWILILTSLVMLATRGGVDLNLWELLKPFMFITLPLILLISSVGVLFDSISFLGSGIKNILYFFIFVFYAGTPIAENAYSDLLGMSIFAESMKNTLLLTVPDYEGGYLVTFAGGSGLKTFVWNGLGLDSVVLLSRFGLILFSIVVVLLAGYLFKWETSYSSLRKRLAKKFINGEGDGTAKLSEDNSSNELSEATLPPLLKKDFRFGILRLVLLNIKNSILGINFWVLGSLAILVGVTVFVPLENAVKVVPAIWFLPIFAWSGIGSKDYANGVFKLTQATYNSSLRTVLAEWLAGFFIALILVVPVILRLLFSGDFTGILQLIVGAMFIPALAMVLGVVSKSSKAFEITFLVLVYILVSNLQSETSFFDFMGILSNSWENGVGLIYILLSVVFIIASTFYKEKMND